MRILEHMGHNWAVEDREEVAIDIWQKDIRYLLHDIRMYCETLHGRVHSRSLFMGEIKLIMAEGKEFEIIGIDEKFPSSNTPLYYSEGVVNEIAFNSKARTWLMRKLQNQLTALKEEYATYLTNLNLLIETTSSTKQPILSTE